MYIHIVFDMVSSNIVTYTKFLNNIPVIPRYQSEEDGAVGILRNACDPEAATLSETRVLLQV